MELNKDEKSLLLFLETRVVDHRGKVDIRYMNKTDLEIAEKWDTMGLIRWGRRRWRDIQTTLDTDTATHWVIFSDAAWKAAHLLRYERGERGRKAAEHFPNGNEKPSFTTEPRQ